MKTNSSMFSCSDSACLTFSINLNPQVDKGDKFEQDFVWLHFAVITSYEKKGRNSTDKRLFLV